MACNQRTLGRRPGCEEDLAASIAAIEAALGAGSLARISTTTGTATFDETSAAEQTAFVLALVRRTVIGSIWLDLVNVTQDLTIRLYHMIDEANYRLFQTNYWTTVEDDGVLIDGFTAYRGVWVSVQCDGAGAGLVSIPYGVM